MSDVFPKLRWTAFPSEHRDAPRPVLGAVEQPMRSGVDWLWNTASHPQTDASRLALAINDPELLESVQRSHAPAGERIRLRRTIQLAASVFQRSVAVEVARLVYHDTRDLNVGRVAFSRGVSRWTLQRTLRASTGLCAKQLVALARLVTVLGCVRSSGYGRDCSRARTHRPLSRAERRAVRELLGMNMATLVGMLREEGVVGIRRMLRERYGTAVVAPDSGPEAGS